jgi:Ca2+-binding EF-hand superfamily protein
VAAEKNLILDRIYTFFDQDKDDLISFDEFVKGLSVLAKGNFDERVYREFFLVYV